MRQSGLLGTMGTHAGSACDRAALGAYLTALHQPRPSRMPVPRKKRPVDSCFQLEDDTELSSSEAAPSVRHGRAGLHEVDMKHGAAHPAPQPISVIPGSPEGSPVRGMGAHCGSQRDAMKLEEAS